MASERQFCLPDLGEGLTEGEVVTWLVAVGDEVAVNQPLVEVETAKAAVELPSPFAGTVSALHAAAGELLAVGAPLVSIRVDADASADEEPEAPAGSGPVLVGYGVTDAPTERRRRRVASPHGTLRPEAGPPGEAAKPVRHGGLEVGRAAEARFADASAPVRAKPPVRRLAKQLGIDLGTVRPTGTAGSVTREDVEAAAALVQPGGAVASPPGDRREAVRGVTRTMATAMTESATSIPSVTEWVEADVTRSTQLLDRMRGLPEFSDRPVTPLLLVAAASLTALRRQPQLNAWFDRDADEIVHRSGVQLGVAVATDRGLVVPHVKEAQALSLAELASDLSDVIARARDGSAGLADLVGGTFTITNVGVFGVDGGTPMIVPGQSAILAFGAWRERPWVERGQIVVRTVCTVSLSFDHRFIDGAAGSRFLRDVADVLEEPALLHLY
jgi:2-oxoisovalerate dehydrogenase E2 component (dihydrolipoyl transacylase)